MGSQLYEVGTKWCLAAPGASRRYRLLLTTYYLRLTSGMSMLNCEVSAMDCTW